MTVHRIALVAAVGCILLGLPASMASAQALPAATAPNPYTGFRMPDVGGSLQYAVTASENIIYGYNGRQGTPSGTNTSTNFSGDLAYLSRSEKHPFSAVTSGGYIVGASSQPSVPFENLAVSQVLKTRSWNFVIADSFSYLPQTPTSGLSGIPGVGDLGINPVQIGSTPTLDILTNYEDRISNSISGTASRNLTGKLSANVTGSYSTQRYLGNASGLDNNQEGGGVGLSRRIDARSSLGLNYNYSHSSFAYSGSSFDSQGLNISYNRQITRQFSAGVSVGPQRVSSSNNTVSAPSTNVSVSTNLAYTSRTTNYTLNYNRGINNGNGVIVGSLSDSITFGASRRLGRYWSVSGNAGYNHSAGLPNLILPSFTNNAEVAGVQGSRGIGRYLSAFVQYTLQRQLYQGSATGNNSYNGTSQVLGFGVSYSPQPLLGRR